MEKTKYFNFFKIVDKLSDLYCENELLTPESTEKAIKIVDDYYNSITTTEILSSSQYPQYNAENLATSVATATAIKLKMKNNYTRDLAELADVILVEFAEIL